MSFDNEFYGSDAQIAVSKRSRDVWKLTRNDPTLAYNGRVVAHVGAADTATPERLAALARLQGATTCQFLPKNRMEEIRQSVEAMGLSTNVWEFCKGGAEAYEAAKNVLTSHALPADIRADQLGVASSSALVADFAAMAGECGVLVMAGGVMRGRDVPGLTLIGLTAADEVVGSAWGYRCYSPDGPYADHAFWGGLTCRPDRRGEKIALVLGALSIVRLWEDLKVRVFCTGIAEGNAASFALCRKLGVVPTDEVGLGVTDPQMFKGSSFTK